MGFLFEKELNDDEVFDILNTCGKLQKFAKNVTVKVKKKRISDANKILNDWKQNGVPSEAFDNLEKKIRCFNQVSFF